jgi:hypothetical protein
MAGNREQPRAGGGLGSEGRERPDGADETLLGQVVSGGLVHHCRAQAPHLVVGGGDQCIDGRLVAGPGAQGQLGEGVHSTQGRAGRPARTRRVPPLLLAVGNRRGSVDD